jgi:hypothetical protein
MSLNTHVSWLLDFQRPKTTLKRVRKTPHWWFSLINKLLLADLADVSGFFDIGGDTYYIDTATVLHHDESSALCQSMNMSLVTFEDPEKWNNMVLWLFKNGIIPPEIYTRFWIAVKCFFAQIWTGIGSGHLVCEMKTRPFGTGRRLVLKWSGSTGDPKSRPWMRI